MMDHEDLIISSRTITEPPAGARVELSMEQGRAITRLYDEQGHDVTDQPSCEADEQE
ncbi:hypothetical protein NGM33_28825 [Nocardiopsis dassonvillei]|uniref:hypothetical protein n=1 Tax=Nocardiopsis dassonvillei TaxID=2014 RepID=UPI0020A250C6|nr:hypothetical protein [Nocardiopsis dassonvillei]MCP3017342.1 hypothetical protein [Nocardiopsis dassonvillei]